MKDLRLAFSISLIYAMVGCAWILVSDWFSFKGISGLSPYWVETFKGIGFVFVTAALLFWLIRRNTRMLLEGEKRLRLLIENAPDAVMVEAQGRIRYVNQTLLKLVGVESGKNVLGREVSELIQGPALKAIRQRLAQVEQLKLPLNAQDVSFQRADGKVVLCEVSAVPITYFDEEGALIFIRDTTERMKYREKQLNAQKMETVRRLAGGLAHDLNNLLQVINGYTELASEREPEEGELGGYLSKIRTAGRQASDLVNKLLAFSRSKDPNEKWGELNATGIISRRVLEEVEKAACSTGAQSEAERPPARPDSAPAPSGKLGSAGGGSVLIAEDDEMVRSLSARILKREGYRVIEAENGCEAVRLFHENAGQIGVVILDVVMPYMDGFQAHDRIREADRHVPILFASGYSAIDSPSNVVLEPGVNLLQKPFDGRVLVAAVRRVESRAALV